MTMPTERRENDMRIGSLETQIRDGFTRMETLLTALDTRLRAVEQCQAEQKAGQTIRIDNHEDALSRLRSRVIELESIMDKAIPWISAIKWLALTVGVSVIGLLWAILTHSITIVVP